MLARDITYQLEIIVHRPVIIQTGRLGVLQLPQCICVYTGSAKKHIDARIARHLRPDKKLRWHIDYLLAHPDTEISRVHRYRETECVINQAVNGVVVLKGFGASDCRAGCISHLKRLSIG